MRTLSIDIPYAYARLSTVPYAHALHTKVPYAYAQHKHKVRYGTYAYDQHMHKGPSIHKCIQIF